jgi:hypothetical protein
LKRTRLDIIELYEIYDMNEKTMLVNIANTVLSKLYYKMAKKRIIEKGASNLFVLRYVIKHPKTS